MRATFPFLFTGVGGSSGPQGEYLYIGAFAKTAAADAYYDANGLTKREGDFFTDQSEVGTVQKSWNGTDAWNYFMIFWDGISSGQLFADLPSITNEAYAFIGTSVYKHNGIDEWVLQYVADGAKERAFYAEGGGVDSAMENLPIPVDSPRYAIIYDTKLDQFGTAIFNGTLWLPSSIQDGSLERPYQVKEVSVSGALIALSNISPVMHGMYANVIVGSDGPVLLEYNNTDGAWYEPSGGRGTKLAPYWTKNTGEDGIDALPAAAADAYGIIGKGTGSPQWLRRLTLIADGALSTAATASDVGALLPGPVHEWVSPILHSLGTPATCYIMDRATGSWSCSSPAGYRFDWNSTVANRIAVRSGTATENTVSIGTRSASTATALLIRRAKVSGASVVSGGAGYLQSISSSDSGQYAGLGYGGTGAANATNWHVFTGTPGLTDTGIALATECSLEAVLVLASNAISVCKDGATSATWSGTTTATTASTAGSRIGAAVQKGAQTTVSFRTFYAMEW